MDYVQLLLRTMQPIDLQTHEIPDLDSEVDSVSCNASSLASTSAAGLQFSSASSSVPEHAAASFARSNATHLFRAANGTWYMRLVVPVELRARHPELPKELKRSTKTAQKRLALARSRKMCLEFFIRYSTGVVMHAPDKQPQLARQSFSLIYTEGSLCVEHSPNATLETIVLMGRCAQILALQIGGRGIRAANDEPLATCAVLARPTSIGNTPDPVSMPDVRPTLTTIAAKPATALVEGDPVWLSECIDNYVDKGGNKFSDISWRTAYQPTFRVFRELLGTCRHDHIDRNGSKEVGILDIEIRSLTRQHIRDLHEGLKVLPPNQGKSTSETEAQQRIRDGFKEKLPRPSLGSVVKKLGQIRPFVRYAKRKGWLGIEVVDEFDLALNAAEADLLHQGKRKTSKPGAVALSGEELQLLFEQEAFVEGAIKMPWKYWIPLFCLYQGFRISEASGLYTDEIILFDGVMCVSIVPDDDDEEEEDRSDAQATKSGSERKKKTAKTAEEFRRLKNAASRRIVPLHPKLIELGFLDYWRTRSAMSNKPILLYRGLLWEEKGMYGRKPSRYIIGLLLKAGVYALRRKVAHSLRSNFTQELQRTMLESDLNSRMLGHTTSTMKDASYGETDAGPFFPVAQTLPYLNKMDFKLRLPTWGEVQNRLVQGRKAPGKT